MKQVNIFLLGALMSLVFFCPARRLLPNCLWQVSGNLLWIRLMLE